RGQPIPTGWAQDGSGAPTTDAGEGLRGSLLPSGGQKGANLALMIEILATALTGAKLSSQASMFGDDQGGPPGVGQFTLAIDPARFSARFAESLGALAESFEAAGVRLPGSGATAGKQDRDSILIDVDADLWQRCLDLAQGR
ncbi:MAG TPA: Ldh family oxidoreductase, partial [Mesorhizobium sp.]